MDSAPDIVCTVHGDAVDDQDDDPEGGADLEAQFADAVACAVRPTARTRTRWPTFRPGMSGGMAVRTATSRSRAGRRPHHRRTVHTSAGDPRRPITIHLEI